MDEKSQKVYATKLCYSLVKNNEKANRSSWMGKTPASGTAEQQNLWSVSLDAWFCADSWCTYN